MAGARRRARLAGSGRHRGVARWRCRRRAVRDAAGGRGRGRRALAGAAPTRARRCVRAGAGGAAGPGPRRRVAATGMAVRRL